MHCSKTNETLLSVMRLSKYLYTKHYDNKEIRKRTMLYSSLLMYIQNNKDISTTDFYYALPFGNDSMYLAISTLEDLNYIYKSNKIHGKAATISLTELGKHIIQDSKTITVPYKYVPKRYRPNKPTKAPKTTNKTK